MPINTILNYLERKQLILNLLTNSYIIKNVNISYYLLEGDSLEIGATEGHEIYVNVADFNIIKFDAIVYDAKTQDDMERCIPMLEEEFPYNAYLYDSKGNTLLTLHRISNDPNER